MHFKVGIFLKIKLASSPNPTPISTLSKEINQKAESIFNESEESKLNSFPARFLRLCPISPPAGLSGELGINCFEATIRSSIDRNSKILTASLTIPSPNKIEFGFTRVRAATVSEAHKIAQRISHS